MLNSLELYRRVYKPAYSKYYYPKVVNRSSIRLTLILPKSRGYTVYSKLI